MGLLFRRMTLLRSGHILLFFILTLSLIAMIPTPVFAESPTLCVQGSDLAPRYIYTGAPHEGDLDNIVMLHLTLECENAESVNLSSITFHRTGLGSDEYVDMLYLYADTNLNDELDIGTDMLLSSTNFTLGKASFSVDLTVEQTTSMMLFVALDISSSAESQTTLGLDIPNESYIVTDEPSDLDFELPIHSKNSTILLDTDGDLNPDYTDSDDDNDMYTDAVEIYCGSDPQDSSSIPLDTDGDYVPDSTDTDDDNDGTPDKYDDFPLDPDRQRDYTIVIIYAAITIFLIVVLLYVRFGEQKTGYRGKKPTKTEDIEEDFDESLIDDESEDEL
jgi:hypothetical protein